MRPRYDASYAVEVQRAHSGRFAIVNPVDPDDPAVADVVADWKKTPGTVGIRIIPDEGGGARAKRSGAGGGRTMYLECAGGTRRGWRPPVPDIAAL
jgi:hypothetical protein